MRHNAARASAVRNRLSLKDYYCYRVAVREHFDETTNNLVNWSSIHKSSKLFQQYILDGWLKVESNNLNYFRQFQSRLRVEMYSGLMDYIQHQTEANKALPGRVMILPSSHQVIYTKLL